MPYESNDDLPDGVRDNMPEPAQTIYREAYNSAWQQYADPDKRRGDDSREEVALKVAWAAVKQQYQKSDGEWRHKDDF